uniref:Uncharacterized protein n=1 Tax=Arundo donax TaxID=35708 RepID=A0A0A9CVK3_ARUDO
MAFSYHENEQFLLICTAFVLATELGLAGCFLRHTHASDIYKRKCGIILCGPCRLFGLCTNCQHLVKGLARNAWILPC